MTTQKKLRILCLHGMVQNAAVFRKKTSVIRKKLDKMADLGKASISSFFFITVHHPDMSNL